MAEQRIRRHEQGSCVSVPFFFRKYHTIMFDAAKEVYRRRHAPDELKNGNRRETSADRRIGTAD